MRFDSPLFALEFWSGLLALYFLILSVSGYGPRLARWAAGGSAGLLLAAGLVFINRTGFAWLILGSTAFTFVAAEAIGRLRGPGGRPRLSQGVLVAAIAVNVAALAIMRRAIEGPTFVAIGVTVLAAHAIAYLVDVFRGDAPTRRPLTTVLYLLHFPVMPGGPILRYRDFESQEPDRVAGLAAFTYGMRRVMIGLVKVFFVARALGRPADTIFALPPVRLTADAAWLGAVCVSLQLYFQWSGYADTAIGVGRMLGFRYPENFRRPYTAQSVRDFWRQWNITAMTWRRFKVAFDQLLAAGCTHIRLDLSLIKYVDSAGISLLTLVNGALLERYGGLRLSSVPDVVRSVLQTTRVDLLITVDR